MIITTPLILSNYTTPHNWIVGVSTKGVIEGQIKVTSIWDKDTSTYLNLDNHSSSLATI